MIQGFIQGAIIALVFGLISWICTSIKNRHQKKNSPENDAPEAPAAVPVEEFSPDQPLFIPIDYDDDLEETVMMPEEDLEKTVTMLDDSIMIPELDLEETVTMSDAPVFDLEETIMMPEADPEETMTMNESGHEKPDDPGSAFISFRSSGR